MVKNIEHAATTRCGVTWRLWDEIAQANAIAFRERDFERQIANSEFPENWYSIFARLPDDRINFWMRASRLCIIQTNEF